MINILFISLVFLFSQQRRGSFCILISSHKGKKRRSDLPEPYRHTMCNSLFIERHHPEQVTSKVLWNHRYRNRKEKNCLWLHHLAKWSFELRTQRRKLTDTEWSLMASLFSMFIFISHHSCLHLYSHICCQRAGTLRTGLCNIPVSVERNHIMKHRCPCDLKACSHQYESGSICACDLSVQMGWIHMQITLRQKVPLKKKHKLRYRYCAMAWFWLQL